MRSLRPAILLLRALFLVFPLPLVAGCPDTPEDDMPSPGTGITPTLGQPSGGAGTPAPGSQPMPPTGTPAPTAPPAAPPGTLAPVVGASAAPGAGAPPSMGASDLLGQTFRMRARCVRREIADDTDYLDPRARTCSGEVLPEESEESDIPEGAAVVSVEADGRVFADWFGTFASGARYDRNVGTVSPDGKTVTVNADLTAEGLAEAAAKNERGSQLTTCEQKARWQNVRDTFQMVIRSDGGKVQAEGRSETYSELYWPPGAGCYYCGGVVRYQMQCTYFIDEPAPLP